MKISAYYKEKGNDVNLLLDYDCIDQYDEVFVSKVFTKTKVPEEIFAAPNVHIGGTGFFFDKAKPLPDEIEHHFPDYHLYDGFVSKTLDGGGKKSSLTAYTDYSIGYLTRGCFRQCKFCVNQNKKKVEAHSPLEEFYDPTRRIICLLDDNFFGCPQWEELLLQLKATNKPFIFKQGLDERLLTDEKCELLFSSKYHKDFIFAFDDIKDYDLIESKLKMIRRHTNKSMMFYVLVGFKSVDADDIENAFKRIELLFRYGCYPYIMRYRSDTDEPWKTSEYRGMYVTLARWLNQPSMAKKCTIRDFADADMRNGQSSTMKYITAFEEKHPDIAKRYFDIRMKKASDIAILI